MCTYYYYFFFQWLGAINVKNAVQSFYQKAVEELPSKKNLQELDKKLEKLLLTGENKNSTKKEK